MILWNPRLAVILPWKCVLSLLILLKPIFLLMNLHMHRFCESRCSKHYNLLHTFYPCTFSLRNSHLLYFMIEITFPIFESIILLWIPLMKNKTCLLSSLSLEQWRSTWRWGDFPPQGTSDNGHIFDCYIRGWSLVDKMEGCCQTPCRHRTSSHNKELSGSNVKTEKPRSRIFCTFTMILLRTFYAPPQ